MHMQLCITYQLSTGIDTYEYAKGLTNVTTANDDVFID